MANISSGCTVTNTFSLPCGEEDIAVLYITYQQNDVTVLEKTKEDCNFEGTTAIVRLSQEDTLKFPQEEIAQHPDRNHFRRQIHSIPSSLLKV